MLPLKYTGELKLGMDEAPGEHVRYAVILAVVPLLRTLLAKEKVSSAELSITLPATSNFSQTYLVDTKSPFR